MALPFQKSRNKNRASGRSSGAPRKTSSAPPPKKTRGGFIDPRRRIDTYTGDHTRLAYNTSRWDAFMYGMRHAATDKAEKGLIDPLREDDTLAGAKTEKVADMAEALGRELFSRMYGNPEKLDDADRTAPDWVDDVHATLDQLPEWEQLRATVQNDPDFAALATNTMLGALQPRLGEVIKVAKARKAGQQGTGGDGENREGLPNPADALRAGLRQACQAASDASQAGKDALNGMAPGLDGTPALDLQSEADRFDLLQAILADPRFKEIARRAGRIKRVSGRAEMRRSKHVYEEVVDVELGADIARLLPSETMMLLDEDTEMLELARIADGRALQYRLEGHEPQGRGPVVFLRDVSGSMSGDPHMWGAAVAVALVSQTFHENRPLVSACFNHEAFNRRYLDKSGMYELDAHCKRVATIAHGKTAAATAAMTHARDGVSGGTDFDAPLKFALRAGVLEPRADFIFLTDGAAYVSDAQLEALNAAKATGLRVFGMTVNGGSVSGPLKSICDELIDIDKVRSDENAAAKAMGRMLGRAR